MLFIPHLFCIRLKSDGTYCCVTFNNYLFSLCLRGCCENKRDRFLEEIFAPCLMHFPLLHFKLCLWFSPENSLCTQPPSRWQGWCFIPAPGQSMWPGPAHQSWPQLWLPSDCCTGEPSSYLSRSKKTSNGFPWECWGRNTFLCWVWIWKEIASRAPGSHLCLSTEDI